MRIYIAGKITGLAPWRAMIEFKQAELLLRHRFGSEVEIVNPLKLCGPNWDWVKCMRVCVSALATCDAIHLLKNWEDSRGAKIEKKIAEDLRLKFVGCYGKN